jgi:putative Holliday junction resolvase
MLAASRTPAVPGRLLAPSGHPSLLETPRTGAVLAFDFGEARIGVAVGELELRIPHALTVIPAVPRDARFRAVAELVAEWRPVLLAVGVPTNASGVAHPFAVRCEKFARSLEGRFGLPVALVDEGFTSCAAGTRLSEAGLGARAQKACIDAAAAAEILAALFAQIDVAA